MNDNDSNPYAPPVAPAAVNESVPSNSLLVIAIVAVGIAAVCYFSFTILWLRGVSEDAKAGRMFLFNAPTFIFWIYSLLRLRRFAFIAGLSTVFVQATIMMYMLYIEFGSTKVVVSRNGGIIVGLLILVWLTQRSTRKRIQHV